MQTFDWTQSYRTKLRSLFHIPCGTCEKVYIGETHRGLETRLKEHKADIRLGKCNTSLFEQIFFQNHVIDWPRATVLKAGLDKRISAKLLNPPILPLETL